MLVPVPSSQAALRTRGRDHVRELARRAVRELADAGLPVTEARLLRRRGSVRDSAGLSAAQRRANLAGSFVRYGVRSGPPSGALLVLVDDVVTSGATLTEAAAALTGGTGRDDPPVLAAVVAATPRRIREQAREHGSVGDLHVVRQRPENVRGRPLDRLSGRGRSD
jgi:hypothetical protein